MTYRGSTDQESSVAPRKGTIEDNKVFMGFGATVFNNVNLLFLL